MRPIMFDYPHTCQDLDFARDKVFDALNDLQNAVGGMTESQRSSNSLMRDAAENQMQELVDKIAELQSEVDNLEYVNSILKLENEDLKLQIEKLENQ